MRLKWSIHQIYFYLVCFVTLIMLIVGITNIVRAGIELVIPIPETEYEYARPAPYNPRGNEGQESTLSKEVIEQEEAIRAAYGQKQKEEYSLHNPLRQIFNGFALIIVAVPVYIFHWRKIPLLT